MSGGFTCLSCGRSFNTWLKPVGDWYCTRACWKDDEPRRDEMRIDRILNSQEAPDTTIRDYYQATCSMCNREQSEHVLSRDELKAMRPLPRCGSCSGHVILQPLLSCAVSSAKNVGRIRTASARPRIRRAQ